MVNQCRARSLDDEREQVQGEIPKPARKLGAVVDHGFSRFDSESVVFPAVSSCESAKATGCRQKHEGQPAEISISETVVILLCKHEKRSCGHRRPSLLAREPLPRRPGW